MDLRRLRTFVAVAELGTVSKAAVRLRIGQPALSRQLSDLQQELGLKLFDRVGRRLALTVQGDQLLADRVSSAAKSMGNRASIAMWVLSIGPDHECRRSAQEHTKAQR